MSISLRLFFKRFEVIIREVIFATVYPSRLLLRRAHCLLKSDSLFEEADRREYTYCKLLHYREYQYYYCIVYFCFPNMVQSRIYLIRKKQESFGVIIGGPVTLTDTRECLKLLRGERAFGVYFQKMQCVQINYKMR